MYTLLTGAKKNAGDFLIVHSAKRLIERFSPCSDCQELPAWLPVDDKLAVINTSRALILWGGPAFQHGLGTRIYPILPVLDQIKVPIIAFGLGWKASPGDVYDLDHFRLPEITEPLLDRLRNDFPYVSCRDVLTCEILKRHGLKNTLMTGCPVWYDPDYFETDFQLPQTFEQIVFTPAEHPMFRSQSIQVMQTIRSLFPKSQIVCSFHRGWTQDAYTPARNAQNALMLKNQAESLSMEAWDVSGSLEGMLRYSQFDLHIGYRVHAHLKMLSMRKPSILLCEDGRARGVLESMELDGVDGWNSGLQKIWFPHPFLRRAARIIWARHFVNKEAPKQLEELVKRQMDSGFAQYHEVTAKIDSIRTQMLKMLRKFPG